MHIAFSRWTCRARARRFPTIQTWSCGCFDDLQAATAALVPAGLSPEDISARIRKGDLVSVGFLNGTPAAYTWTRFGDLWAKEFGLTIRPRTREVIQYDSLVLKPFRRQGLQFAIAAPVLDYLQQNGYATGLAWVNLLNRASYKNQRKWDKKLIMIIVSIKLPGMERRNVSLGAPLDCLFTKPSAGSDDAVRERAALHQ